jgi:Tfp pilus assembly protein PilX
MRSQTGQHFVLGEKTTLYLRSKSLKQRGLAMVLSLFYLLLSTLLGVASMSTTVVEERMLRNSMLQAKAFQIAELALLEGEAHVRDNAQNIVESVLQVAAGVTKRQSNVCAGGYCIPMRFYSGLKLAVAATEHWRNQSIWTTDGRFHSVTNALISELGIVVKPKYIIEFLRYINLSNDSKRCDTNNSGSSDEGDHAHNWQTDWPLCPLDEKEFRITAIGYAGNKGEVRVMLQSTFVAGFGRRSWTEIEF